MKRTLSLLLALVLSFSLATPAYAKETGLVPENESDDRFSGLSVQDEAAASIENSYYVPEEEQAASLSDAGQAPDAEQAAEGNPAPDGNTNSDFITNPDENMNSDSITDPDDYTDPEGSTNPEFNPGTSDKQEIMQDEEKDLTEFTVDFKGELKGVIIRIQYFDETTSEWKDYPNGEYRLEETTPSIKVNDFDMALYGNKVQFVISDFSGTFSKAVQETTLPAEIIEIPVGGGLFDMHFTAETQAILSGEFVYTGKALSPFITVEGPLTDPEYIDSQYFDVKITNNKNAGTATVTVTAKSPFVNGCTGTFKISPFDLASGNTTVKIGNQLYTGKAIKPDPVVKTVLNGKTVKLEKGTDYTVSYKNNTNIGTATVTIKGKNNFSGTVTKDFTILDNTITSVKLKNSSMLYTGKARTQTKSTVVKWGKKVLTLNTDYTISYKNNVEVGTATMIVKGKGAYRGTIKKDFKIVYPVKKLSITGIKNKEYTGKAIKQDIVVKYGDKTLVKGTDYKISYKNNVEVGRASVIITGKGYYTGSKTKTFKITKPVSKLTITGIKARTYTGKAIELKITVKDGSKKLVKDTDYTVTYANNIGPGKATVTIRGKGFYTGKVKQIFMIRKLMDECSISGIHDVTYNGKAQKFDIVVKDGSKVLVKGTDYTVSYKNNKNAGTGTVTIKGKGNYKGSVKQSFEIKKAPLTVLTLKYASMEYTGEKRTQTASLVVKSGKMVLTKSRDFSVKYLNNINPGTATVTVTGKGNFTGSISKNFTITKYKLKKKDVVLEYTTKPYADKAYQPKVTVTVHYKNGKTEVLTNTKYKVTYKNNKNAGKAKVIVEAVGAYHTGKITQTFKITPVEISSVTLSSVEYTYDGTEKKPVVTAKATVSGKTVTLKKDTDYTVTYKNNVNAGTATATVTGKGNFKGTTNKQFTIKKAPLSLLTLSGSSFTYTGSAICPSVSVKSGSKVLTLRTDYSLSYTNNVNAGTATVTASGMGNYSGTLSARYTINPRSLSSASVTLDVNAVMKNQKNQLYPSVTSVIVDGRKLTGGTDYSILNPQITNYDKPYECIAYISINGKGNYTGTAKKQFVAMSDNYFIPEDYYKNDIRKGSYRKGAMPLVSLYYNQTVKNRYYAGAGKDFTVTYSGNNAAGIASVRVKGFSKSLIGLDKTFYYKVVS